MALPIGVGEGPVCRREGVEGEERRGCDEGWIDGWRVDDDVDLRLKWRALAVCRRIDWA